MGYKIEVWFGDKYRDTLTREKSSLKEAEKLCKEMKKFWSISLDNVKVKLFKTTQEEIAVY